MAGQFARDSFRRGKEKKKKEQKLNPAREDAAQEKKPTQ